jgi:hypothetical protein
MPACFSLDLVAGGLGVERQVINRKGQQTKVITVTPMSARRAGTAVASPMKVIDGLLEARRTAVVASALGKSSLVASNVVSSPMVPFACGRIRVVTEKDETAGRCWGGPPVKGWRKVLSVTGETGRDRCAARKGTRVQLHRSPPDCARLSQSWAGLIDPDQGHILSVPLWLDVHQEAIEKRPLAGEDLLPRDRKREPCCVVDLGNANGAATSRRPLDLDLVAAHGADIKSTFQRKGVNYFAGTLAHITKRSERAGGVYTEFFFEFPPGGGFRILSVIQFPFRDRPGTKIAAAPKRPAWMDQKNKNIRLAVAIHQNASALDRHTDWSTSRKTRKLAA